MFSNLKKTIAINLQNLPNEEIPLMESHLRALYFQTYYLLALGFYNASLVLCGILLESLTKEKLHIEGVSDENIEKMDFRESIIKSKNILNSDEISFLESKKNDLRNPYTHYNMMKLSKGIYYPTFEIKNVNIVEKLKELHGLVKQGKLTEAQARQKLIEGISPVLKSSKEFRPIAQLAKSQIEEEGYALKTFLEVDKFVRDFSEKYFDQGKRESQKNNS